MQTNQISTSAVTGTAPVSTTPNNTGAPATLSLSTSTTLAPVFTAAIPGKELADGLEDMPACCEKSLSQMLFLLKLKLQKPSSSSGGGDIVSNVQLLTDQLLYNLSYVEKHLAAEELNTIDNINVQIDLLRKDVMAAQWQAASDGLRRILALIRPFDIRELKRLVKKTEAAAEAIRGRDIILFMGDTGSGKSTAIQFLAGSEMRLKQVGELTHIEAVDTRHNKALSEVKSSPYMVSETRYITAVPVTPSTVGGSNNNVIVLCDTPGFEATEGCEVDVANGVGVINAVRGSHSVRPLIFFSAMKEGNKMDMIREMGDMLVRVFRDIGQRLPSFTYVFTKYRPDSLKGLSARINDFVAKMTDEDKSNKPFCLLCDDVKTKTEYDDDLYAYKPGPFTIDVLNKNKKNPGRILDMLMKTLPIEYPAEVFQIPITQKSKDAVNSQVHKHQASITSGLKRADYPLVIYKLGELKMLADMLQYPSVAQGYKDGVTELKEHITAIGSDAKKHFNRCFLDSDSLTREDVERYKLALIKMNLLNILKIEHLSGQDIIDTDVLIQNLIMQVELMLSDLLKKGVGCREAELRLKKIKLLHDSFSEFSGNWSQQFEPAKKIKAALQEKYAAVIRDLQAEFDALIANARNAIASNDVGAIAGLMDKIISAKNNLQIVLAPEVFTAKYEGLQADFMNRLNAAYDGSIAILAKQDLMESDLKQLAAHIALLEMADGNNRLHAHIQRPKINEIYKRLTDKFKEHFDSLYVDLDKCMASFMDGPKDALQGSAVIAMDNASKDKVRESMLLNSLSLSSSPQGKNRANEQTLAEVERIVRRMVVLRKSSPSISGLTDLIYYKAKTKIKNYLDDFSRSAEDILDMMLDDNDRVDVNRNINYRKLNTCIFGIRNLQWFKEFEPGDYDRIVKAVELQVVKHVQALKIKLMDMDLGLKQHAAVATAGCLLSNISNLKPLCTSLTTDVTDLAKQIEEATKWFTEEVGKTFGAIKADFAGDGNSIEFHEKRLKELEKMHADYLAPDLRKEFMQKHAYKSIDDLFVKIAAKQKERDALKGELDNMPAKIEKDKEKLATESQQMLKQIRQYEDLVESDETAARKYLASIQCNDKPCKTIEELKNERAKKVKALKELDNAYANQKSSLQVKLAGLTKELADLTANEKEYKGIPDIAKPTLKEFEYDLKNLISAIDALKTKISNFKQRNQTRIFEHLDPIAVERVLNYLEACSKVASLRDEAKKLSAQVDNYLKNYGNFVCKEMSNFWTSIINYSSVDNVENQRALPAQGGGVSGSTSTTTPVVKLSTQQPTQRDAVKFYNYASSLLCWIRDMTLLEDKFPGIFSRFFEKDQLKKSEWQRKLGEQLLILVDEINRANASGRGAMVEDKKAIAQFLSILDVVFVPSTQPGGFTDLYRKTSDMLNSAGKELNKKVVDLINARKYGEVSDELQSLFQLRDIANLDALHGRLSRSLILLAEETERKTAIMGGDDRIVPEKVRSIVNDLGSIEEALSTLQQYLSSTMKQQLQDTVKSIKGTLTTVINASLDAVRSLMKLRNFQDARERMKDIIVSRDLLGNYCDKEVITAINDVQKSIQSGLDEVIDLYKTLPIAKYNLHPPKVLYKNLHVDDKDGKPVYKEKWNLIENMICDNFRNAMETIKAQVIPPTNTNNRRESLGGQKDDLLSFDSLKAALGYLAEPTRIMLEGEIGALEKVIASASANHKQRDIECMQTDDPVLILKRINEHESSGRGHLANSLKQEAVKRFQERCDQIIDTLNNPSEGEYTQMFVILRKLFDYHRVCSSSMSTLGSQFNAVQEALRRKIDNIMQIVSRAFTQDDSGIALHAADMEDACKRFGEFGKFVDSYSIVKLIIPDVKTKIGDFNGKLVNYFSPIKRAYSDSAKGKSILDLKNAIEKIKRWDTFFLTVRRYVSSRTNNTDYAELNDVFKNLDELCNNPATFERIQQQIEVVINGCRDEILSIDRFLSDPKTDCRNWSDIDFETHYRKWNDKLQFIMRASEILIEYLPKSLDMAQIVKGCQQELLKIVSKFSGEISNILKKHDLDTHDYDRLNLNYRHIQAFKQFMKNLPIKDDEVIKDILAYIDNNLKPAEQKLGIMGKWGVQIVPDVLPNTAINEKTFYLVAKNREKCLLYRDPGDRNKIERTIIPGSVSRLIRHTNTEGEAFVLLSVAAEQKLTVKAVSTVRSGVVYKVNVYTLSRDNVIGIYVDTSKGIYIDVERKNKASVLVKKGEEIWMYHLNDDGEAKGTKIRPDLCDNFKNCFPEIGKPPILQDVNEDDYEDIITTVDADGEKKRINSANTKIQSDPALQVEVAMILRGPLVHAANGIVTECLIKVKSIADNVPMFKEDAERRINNFLAQYQRSGGEKAILELGSLLTKSGVGSSIVAEFQYFKAVDSSGFIRRTQTYTINLVLDELREGEVVDIAHAPPHVNQNTKNTLLARYNKFKSIYEKLVSDNLSGARIGNFRSSIDNIKAMVRPAAYRSSSSSTTSKGDGKYIIKWDTDVNKSMALELMAHVFALWTLTHAKYYFDAEGLQDQKTYLLQPHPAQVVSIFRLLGIGESCGLDNHLIEIGTGEGKSITLAVTAVVLALLGFEVSCACYSQYLSDRDYNEFKPIFELLGVAENIHYGTFNKLCEDIINENGDVRKLAEELMRTGSTGNATANSRAERPKVLLIDEVDVFFNQDFYGSLYTPAAILRSDDVTKLIRYIWQGRNNNLSLRDVEKTPEYIACCASIKCKEIVKEAVKDMLADVKDFASQNYIVKEGIIYYQYQDGLSSKLVFGYKTLFAYFDEHEKKNISDATLAERIGIKINCGSFSYAEVPKLFYSIMGVTGTLRTLSETEKRIVRADYKIQKFTYAPSVFGVKRCDFDVSRDIHIEKEEDYFNALGEEIKNRLTGRDEKKRAVMVFFANKAKLEAFYNSPACPLRGSINVMTEEVSPQQKNRLIRMATTTGRVSLLTRTFGRGTDFVCRDEQVRTGGGVHVIQTFLSEEVSEEVQIKGRTARQGEQGSFSMFLLVNELESFRIKPGDVPTSRDQLWGFLCKKRSDCFAVHYQDRGNFVIDAEKNHKESVAFLRSIVPGQYQNLAGAAKFLLVANRGAGSEITQSRTICLMDATGSMSTLLQRAKNTVSTMFERAYQVLKDQHCQGAFAMQFAVYRNYSSTAELLFQFSPWASKPDDLRVFMDAIVDEGGQGNEAVEVGLAHVNQEVEKNGVSQAIVIGDAPPNTQGEVATKRAGRGETYWGNTAFKTPTFYQSEVNKLAQKKVPVHTFFVADRAKSVFQEIASATHGNCLELDVNSSSGAELLTKHVTETILQNIDDKVSGGGSTQLVNAYRATKWSSTR